MKTTYVKGHTLGDHFAEGWWASQGFPKIEKYVVVEVEYGHDRCALNAIEEFHRIGARQVQILPYK